MKLNGLDLNKLRIFCAVVEGAGYRGASEAVGLTRSAISQAITGLEAQIGQPLFYRVGTKLVLTEDSARFYEEVRRYQQGVEGAFSKMARREPAAGGLLRIGAYLEFAKSKLMPVIEDFLLKNPEVQIQFLFDSPSRLNLLLEKGRIDLAISIFSHSSRRIQSQQLNREELVLVGRKDLVGPKPSAAELMRIPVIDYFPSHLLFKRWWAIHFQKTPVKARTRVFAATAEMVLEMAERRLGVGVVPRYLVRPSQLERLQIVEPTSRKLTDYLWINRRKESREHAVVRLFLSALKDQLTR